MATTAPPRAPTAARDAAGPATHRSVLFTLGLTVSTLLLMGLVVGRQNYDRAERRAVEGSLRADVTALREAQDAQGQSLSGVQRALGDEQALLEQARSQHVTALAEITSILKNAIDRVAVVETEQRRGRRAQLRSVKQLESQSEQIAELRRTTSLLRKQTDARLKALMVSLDLLAGKAAPGRNVKGLP